MSELVLLTLDDIANLHQVSVRLARDVIVRLPGFPAPAPTSTPRRRRWLRRDVLGYINGGSVKYDERSARQTLGNRC